MIGDVIAFFLQENPVAVANSVDQTPSDLASKTWAALAAVNEP